MAKAKDGNQDKEKEQVRLQVVVCEQVATEVERHARELERSQAWVAGWAIRNTLRDKGEFGAWMVKRIKRASIYQRWATPLGTEQESRLQLRMDRDVVDDLEMVATALNQSSLKLAGLMIEHALEFYGPSLFTMKTRPGKFFRWLVQGDEDFKGYDVNDATESQTAKLEDSE